MGCRLFLLQHDMPSSKSAWLWLWGCRCVIQELNPPPNRNCFGSVIAAGETSNFMTQPIYPWERGGGKRASLSTVRIKQQPIRQPVTNQPIDQSCLRTDWRYGYGRLFVHGDLEARAGGYSSANHHDLLPDRLRASTVAGPERRNCAVKPRSIKDRVSGEG